MKYITQHHPPPQQQRRGLGARYGPAIGTELQQTPQASVTDAIRNKKQNQVLREEDHPTKTNIKSQTKKFKTNKEQEN